VVGCKVFSYVVKLYSMGVTLKAYAGLGTTYDVEKSMAQACCKHCVVHYARFSKEVNEKFRTLGK
jgi:hypothetical protein